MKFCRTFFSFTFLLILLSTFSGMKPQAPLSSNPIKKPEHNTNVKSGKSKSTYHNHSARRFQLAYSTIQDSNEIIPIDLKTGSKGTPICLEHQPKSIVIASETCIGYILVEGSHQIIPYNLSTGTTLPPITLEMIPQNITVNRSGSMAYVIYEDSDSINVVDLASGASTVLLSIDGVPTQLSLAPDDKTLYVTCQALNKVIPIDTESLSVQPSISLHDQPHAMAITSDGRIACIEKSSQKTLNFYDANTGDLTGSLTFDKSLDTLEINLGQNIHPSADGKTVYLSQENSNEIISLNTDTLSLESSVYTGHQIKNIALYPKQGLEASFSIELSPNGEATLFDASSSEAFNDEIIDYSWNFGDGHTVSSSSPIIKHTYQSPGHFAVSLTVRESMKNFPFETLEGVTIDKTIPLSAEVLTSVVIPEKAKDRHNPLAPKTFTDRQFFPPGGSSKANTSTTISSSAQPAVFGESITFSATVTSLTDTGIPSGTVSFIDTILGTIGTGTLDPTGNATFTISSLAVGTYSLSANYSGDIDYNPSSSAPPQFTQNVNHALTSTSLVGAPNPSYFGNSVTFTATISVVSPGVGTPTGTVTFYDGPTQIGTSSISGGQATYITSSLNPGLHNVTAVYNGNSDFMNSTSPNWTQTIDKGTTSTSVITSLTPSPFGNSVTFTANVSVTNGTGTPTGTVTFTDGATTLGTQTLSSGTATLSTSALAVGTHTILATYNGDTNFANSGSSGLSQVISQGTTNTDLLSSLNPSTYGQAITFTANVSIGTGAGTPTGTVTFKDGATLLGTSTLNGSGVATFSTSTLAVNTHSMTAIYNGDTNFSASTSLALSQVVGKATPSNIVTSSLSPSNFGNLVTFTATVSSPTTLGLPSGSVEFYNGPTLIGTGTLNGTGPNTATATFSLSTLNAGTLSITGQYSGDGNFIAVTSPIFTQVVIPVSSTQTTVFSNSPNPSEYGQAVILRATVTGSTGSPPAPPTGFITFFDGATPIATAPVSPVPGNPNSGTATYSDSLFSIGSHTVTAQYLGDINYPASSLSAPMTQKVIQSSTTSSLTTSVTPSVFGQNVTFTVTVIPTSPGMGEPTGTVAFYNGSIFLGNSSPLIPGINFSTATFSTTALSLGSHTILGIYSGDVNFITSSTPTLTQVVNQDPTNTLIISSSSSPGGFNFGSYITFTAQVTAASPGSGTPTGTVQFFDGATLIGAGTLTGGIATTTTVNLYPSPPSHSITAVYNGDTNFITSTSPIFSQDINSTLPTSTTVTSGRNSSPGGTPVTYSATVVAAPGPGMGIPGIPTGTVTFTDTTIGLVIGTSTLNASGVATITESGSNLPFVPPAPDIHLIQAVYNGQSAVFDPSTSPLFNQYIVPLDTTTTTLTAVPNPSTQAGATLVATVNVVGGVPPYPTDGTVTFYEGSTNLGTIPLTTNGTATLMPNNLHFGSDTIIAIYSGDTTQFAMSVSNPVNLQVQQTDMLTTSTTVSSSLANSTYCQPVTLRAVVVETQGFYIPTGTVTFFDGAVSIGTAILNATGTAQLTTTSLSVGTHSITATYNSDSNYAFSFGNTITQTVTPNNTSTALSIIPNLSSTPYGQNLILSAIVSSTSPYNTIPTGSITFSSGSTILATVPLDPTGEAVYMISTLNVGSYTLTASYNADRCFVTSSATQNHIIFKINPETSLTSSPNPSTYGDALTLTATVNSSFGTPTGSVTFYNGSTALGTAFLQEGTASLMIASPLTGYAILSAHYSGDTNFLPIITAATLQTINKAPTATCLVSYTTNPSEYGQLIFLSATVSSDIPDVSPGITGSVTFTNGSVLLGTVPLNGCYTAQLQTSNLNLGSSNNIVATYSGDSNFATSVSSTLNLTVEQASTLTTVTSITSSPNPPQFGTLVTFNVSVNPISPGSGIPTGTITGYYGSTSIGSSALVNGVASFSSSILPVGVQTILVKYSGDVNFTASQTTTTETVVAVATTSTITSSSNPSVFGQPVTYNITVTSSQGTPTGIVSFLDGTTTLSTETLNSAGTASFTTSSLTVGNHTIKAVYSGSANLAPSTTSTLNQVVNKDATTTTLISTPNHSFYGETAVFSATVAANSPGSGVPTGTITFKNGSTTIGTGILNSNGTASLAISTSLPASPTPYSISAVYSGDGNFITSTGTTNQTINKSASIIKTTYFPNPANFGQAVTLNVTVDPINNGTGIPSGIVTASYGSQIVGSGTLLSNGTVSFQTTSLPAGTLGIVVQYLGDSNFLSSTIPLTETVDTATSTTTITSSNNPSIAGQPVTFTISVTSTASLTGIITIFDGTTILGTQALDAFGNSTFTTSQLSPGTHSITASYSGDGTNSPSDSTSLSQVVNQSMTTTTLSSILNPSLYGETVTLRAAVFPSSPGAGSPTGTVTFYNGVVPIPGGAITLDKSGIALFSLSSLPVGTNTIKAVYSGDTNFVTSTSNTLSQSISKTPTITGVTSSLNPATYGSSVLISGTVTPLNNGSTTIPVGTTVTAFYGATVVGSGTLNAGGQYLFSLSNLPAGTLAIEIKYPGDTNFDSSSITLTQTVVSDTSTISISSSLNPSTFGQSVTIANTATLASGQTPTGTVTYYDGTTPIGTTNVNQPLVISTLGIGSHPLKVVYNGNTNATGSTSAVVNQIVNQNTTTTVISSNLNPSVYGNNVTFTANVTPSFPGTPTGFVTFLNGTTFIGIGELDNTGHARFSTSQIPAGTNSMTAVYSGDTNYTTSTSPSLNQVVNKVSASATTATILSSTPNPSVFGNNVTFFANVTSASGIPTGNVTYFDGATPLATVNLYDGFGIYSINSLTPGNHNITVVYNGDSNFSPSLPSGVYNQVVEPVSITKTTVTNLTSSNNPSNYGDPVTFNVQVTSAATPPPYPSGFVTLYTGSVPLVTLALNSTGGASYTTSALPAGILQIVALYSGDSAFSASTNVITQLVNAIPTTTALASSLNPSNFGDMVTFTATVSSGVGNPIPTGSISFYNGPSLVETVLLSNMGIANFTTSNLTTGSQAIKAVYNADPNFNTSNQTLNQIVNPGVTTTTILSSSANPSNTGEPVTFIANTSAISGNPTGTVTFYDGGTPIGSSSLFGGLAFFSTTTLSEGSHSITASYGGNVNNAPSTSLPFIQLVINQSAILQPPRQFCGRRVVSEFLNKNHYSNVLTWVAPGTGAEPKFYKIYRNAQLTDLIAVVSGCGPLTYTDARCKKDKTYTYYIVSANTNGVSSSVSVTIYPFFDKCSQIRDLFSNHLKNTHSVQTNQKNFLINLLERVIEEQSICVKEETS